MLLHLSERIESPSFAHARCLVEPAGSLFYIGLNAVPVEQAVGLEAALLGLRDLDWLELGSRLASLAKESNSLD